MTITYRPLKKIKIAFFYIYLGTVAQLFTIPLKVCIHLNDLLCEPKYMNRIIMTFDYKKQHNIFATKVLYMAEVIIF